MRTKNTLINISAGVGNQLIITALSFISRTVFISSLGIEYLGINALFTSILAMVSLAEAGIGSSIVYNLYKPVAEQDRERIKALMRLYKRAYIIIALVILFLGLCLFPFLGFFVHNTSVENLHFIYSLFLINTVAPYFFVYKHSFLNVNQKNYIVTGVFTVSSILSTLLKIGILYYTQNFIYYLIVESAITIVTSVILSMIVDRMYPFLREKAEQIDAETKQNIVRNMKAIMLQNVGNFFVFGADSILISSFVSVAAVGLYSNYKMLIDICRTFLNQVFNNMYHSVGNLVAKETKEKIYSVYKGTMLLNFWLYSLAAIIMMVVIEPFIRLWIGSQFLLSQGVLIVLVIIFFERGMRNSITTVKTTAGIFHEDRFAPLCQAAINLIVSITLVQFIGITGIFIGTLVSALAVPFWTTPYLTYKNVFERPFKEYVKRYMYYLFVGLIACIATASVCNLLIPEGFLGICLRVLLGFTIPNLIYIMIFYKTEEYKYLAGLVKTVFRMLLKKLAVQKSMQQ